MKSETGRARKALVLVPLAALLAAAMALASPALAHHHGDFGGGPAGKIASFDKESGQLVIDLTEGGQISGLVTQFTWIETGEEACPGPPTARRDHFCPAGRRHHGDGNGWGWHHGNGDTADLVPGATVEDALLFLKDGKAFYAKVELGGEEEAPKSASRH